MELKEFIATGIIETYLLGMATPQEVDMVNAMLKKYPSLKIEIDAVEDALLRMAESNTADVNDRVKQNILSSIQFNQSKSNHVNHQNPEPAKMVTMPVSNKKLVLRYGLVASIGLLIISTVLNLVMLNNSRKMTGEMARLDRENTEMKSSITSYTSAITDLQNQFKVLTDVNSKPVILKGTDVSPSSLATVYWNKQSKEVYLHLKNLPDPPQDMQYQLWAIVDGKPVDAGVFDTGKEDTLQNMLKASGIPQAFAVTLEKRGGSATPTLEAMFLLGEV